MSASRVGGLLVRRVPLPLVIVGLVVLAALLALASLSVGRVSVPMSVWFDGDDPRGAIILGLRLPRTLLGLLVGAALGAVLTLYFGQAAQAPWVLPLAAMTGAAGGVALLLSLAGGSSSIVTFVLAGVILNTVAGAGVALALTLAPDPWAVSEIVDWLMGSLADRSAGDVELAAPLILAGCGTLAVTARALDALTLGETGARSLGIDLGRTRLLLAIGVGLATGASVAATGVVGFVGLVVPHLLRPLIGGRPGALLIPSAIGGAVLTVAADILVRLTPAANEIKLGVAMAALGGPFFLALLIGMRRRIA